MLLACHKFTDGARALFTSRAQQRVLGAPAPAIERVVRRLTGNSFSLAPQI